MRQKRKSERFEACEGLHPLLLTLETEKGSFEPKNIGYIAAKEMSEMV